MFKTIGKFSKKHSTYIAYYKKVKCKICNTVQTVRVEKKNIICHTCEDKKKHESIVGKTIGNYVVLSFKEKKDNKLFYTVKCLKCGNIAVKRKDCLKSSKTCSECKSNGITPTIKAPRNVLLSHYKSGAKIRNLQFTLSEKEFDTLISSNCHYCNSEPSVYLSDKRYNKTKEEFKRNGLDRKDSSKGYTSENTVACCAMCNKMKMDFDKTEWLSQMTKIHKNMIECSTTIL